MSIIKEKYHSIPDSAFDTASAEELFEFYLTEFFPNQSSSIHHFVRMFLNVIRDFLIERIEEKTLSLIVDKSLYSEKTKEYHFEPYLFPYNDIISVIHDLHDINWTQGSPLYDEYLTELKKKWENLVAKYEGK